MGQTIFQKLSLYEMLTMLVIGALCMPILSVLFSFSIDLISLYFWIISYCLGLVLHRTIEFFRNLWSYSSTYSCPNFFLTIFHRNNPKVIKDCQYKVEHDNKDYYLQYYRVKNSSISSLEAQEAFLRDLFWVEIIYLIIYILHIYNMVGLQNCPCGFICNKSVLEILFGNDCIFITILVILILSTLLSRYATQRKIYELVQEVYYINNAIDNKNNSTNNANNPKEEKNVGKRYVTNNMKINANSTINNNINKKNKHRRG
ncbi:MAG: hypothetical protein IKP45_12165 [Bacteroidales bacterium]|nr:hypothetical protein [Bacteroidales bacterium]